MKRNLVLMLASSVMLMGFKCAAFDAEKAINELQTILTDNYAYLHDREQSAVKLFNTHQSRLHDSKTTKEFRDNAQAYLRAFTDPHLNLGPYDRDDFSVYPTGSDIFVQFDDRKLVVYDIKAGSDAHIKGLKPGMEISAIDGQSIELAMSQVTGMTLNELTKKQRNYAANIALGGRRHQPRRLLIHSENGDKEFNLAASYSNINALKKAEPVTIEVYGQVGYIRFNNALGDTQTSDFFKKGLRKLVNTKGLIIDLRNTPSGGNTGVAEPILGHFTNKVATYQTYKTQSKGQLYSESVMQFAQVLPENPYIVQPFVVLAGRWTGSMGEGMVIGLDALGAQAVIGAPMADLLGGIKQVKLPYSDSWIEVGFERLYHTNGEYREDFIPQVLLKSADIDASGNDVAMQKAFAFFK
ncbi:S41 family peptidase [Pseudoalteromonas aurantia]|uniref:Tail specific protease domain-containing protein n=1 Tax=Pseudoalteromonas aurantia 208 TaxID=1314867 RepID=A0ABR9EA99_9GAMM|nr:S41 family peptidase [Pseudoalteromonas aurantia]MBE0367916.1 hypothetical protein [Pseudoalteromonas aurantia 208]